MRSYLRLGKLLARPDHPGEWIIWLSGEALGVIEQTVDGYVARGPEGQTDTVASPSEALSRFARIGS